MNPRVIPDMNPNAIFECEAHELQEGDHFSYHGSFKVYRVMSHWKQCPDMDDRIIIVVTDGGIREGMKVRLPGMLLCRLYGSFNHPLQD